MFMGKTELDNTLQLLKIRTKECSEIKGITYILEFLFGIDMISLIKTVFIHDTELQLLSLTTYSNWGFMLMICVCIFYTIGYKNYNDRHQIFPQSNKSRFTSYELFCYISFLKIQLLALLFYCIQYAIGMGLNLVKGNLEYVYQFSLHFTVAGFFVNLMYGFLVIAITILIGAFDRKFQWKFRIIGIGIIFVVAILPRYEQQTLFKLVEIVTKETSITLFLVKSICIWFILISIYHITNKFTHYYKAEKEFHLNKLFFVIPIIMAAVFYFFLNTFSNLSNNSTSTSKVQTNSVNNVREEKLQITVEEADAVVDVSDIPDGSILNITMDEKYRGNYNIIFNENFTNTSDNKILFEYKPPINVIDSIDMNLYIKPELDVKIDDNTLNFNFTTKENVKVIFSYPYSFMRQFDYFKGKQIFKEQNGSMSGSGTGTVTVYLPEEKHFTIMD